MSIQFNFPPIFYFIMYVFILLLIGAYLFVFCTFIHLILCISISCFNDIIIIQTLIFVINLIKYIYIKTRIIFSGNNYYEMYGKRLCAIKGNFSISCDAISKNVSKLFTYNSFKTNEFLF